jgi:hypothetical protein
MRQKYAAHQIKNLNLSSAIKPLRRLSSGRTGKKKSQTASVRVFHQHAVTKASFLLSRSGTRDGSAEAGCRPPSLFR